MENSEHNSIPYTIIDGIRRYGETSPVTEQDVRVFRRTDESYAHIIRHMDSLSREAEKRILGKMIMDEGTAKVVDKELLKKLLDTAVSKFHKDIDDPLTIISFAEEHVQEKVKRRERILWQKTPRGDYFCFLATYISPLEKSFFNLDPDEQLGLCHVVEITEENESRITQELLGTGEKRDQVMMNMLHDTPPPSSTLIIVLHKPDMTTPATVYTCYTGIIAPPIPNQSQTKEEFDYNRVWWDKHAFIFQQN